MKKFFFLSLIFISFSANAVITSPGGGGGGSGGDIAGSDGQIQFNTSGAFAADAGLLWDATLHALIAGNGATATGQYATALGKTTTASGSRSLAAGSGSTASGNFGSTALGLNTTSSGQSSFTANNSNSATATDSAAFNSSNVASGTSALAIGNSTTASGLYSLSGGHGTLAHGDNQTALGQYNIAVGSPGSPADADEIFSVGIGADNSTRETAFSVRRDGLLDAHSNILTGLADPIGDTDAVTLSYFNNNVGGGSAPQTSITVDTIGGTAYGSESGSNIVRFANITRDDGGDDISYSDDAVIGNKFVINTAGTYCASFTAESDVGAVAEVTVMLNPSPEQRTATIPPDITPANVVCFGYEGAIAGGLTMVHCGACLPLAATDVVQFATVSSQTFNSNRAHATLTRVN